MGCVGDANPKSEIQLPRVVEERTASGEIVRRMVLPPSRFDNLSVGWLKIAHVLEFDKETLKQFVHNKSIFSDIVKQIESHNYSDEEIYELIKRGNGESKRTSNSQRPYSFYYTQKLDEGVLFVLFKSRSDVGSIKLHPNIKKVGRTELYEKAYHIDFDITNHMELNRRTSTITIFSRNGKSYSRKSDRMSSGGRNYSPLTYHVQVIVEMVDFTHFTSDATDPAIKEKCKNVKMKQLCYDQLLNGAKK